MDSPYAVKYARYAQYLSTLSNCLPRPVAVKLARLTAAKLSPDTLLNDKIYRHLRAFGYSDSAQQHIVKAYHQQACVTGLDVTSMASRTLQWAEDHVVFSGEDALVAAANEGDSGVLFLSFHFHDKFLCLAMLGALGLNVNALAMDYRVSEVYPHPRAGQYYADFFQSVEALLNAGRPVYLNGKNTVSVLKGVSRGLEKGQVLWSLNDIYSSFAGSKRSIEVDLLAGRLACPIGSIEVALAKQAAIFTGWLYWDEPLQKYRFKAVQLSTADGVEGVIEQYTAILKAEIERDPSVWEGWKLLP